MQKRNLRIDVGLTSISAGYTMKQQKIKVRIDKLTLVSDLTNIKNKKTLADKLNNLERDDYYCCKHKYNNRMHKQYHRVISIWKRGEKAKMLRIEHEPIGSKKGCIRFELSPQHFAEGELNAMLTWLAQDSRLGTLLYTLIFQAWVTRIDYAMDIMGAKLTDYHFGLKGAACGKMHETEDDFGGIRLGSTESSLFLALYDKETPDGEVILAGKQSAGLDVEVQAFSRFLRIEARYFPKGKRALMLKSLGNISDPLEHFIVYDRRLENDVGLDDLFRYLLNWMTLPEAMQKMSEYLQSGKKTDLRNYLDRIRRVLKKYEYQWFDKAEVWSLWPGCVEKLGILGQMHRLQEYQEKASVKSKARRLTLSKSRYGIEEERYSKRVTRRKRFIS